MADLHHLARDDARRHIGELLERFELADAADRMAATYSGGMRRRLDLAMTLIGAPQIIFLESRPPALTCSAAARCTRSSAASPATAPQCS